MKSPEEQTHLRAHDTTVRWANERTATTHNLTLKTFSFILTNTSRYINNAIQIKFIKPSTEFRHFGGNHLYVHLLWCTWKEYFSSFSRPLLKSWVWCSDFSVKGSAAGPQIDLLLTSILPEPISTAQSLRCGDCCSAGHNAGSVTQSSHLWTPISQTFILKSFSARFGRIFK